MSELSPNVKCCIHILCFSVSAILLQSIIIKRSKGDAPKKDNKPSSTPAKPEPFVAKSQNDTISLPHQHEKKMTERLIHTRSVDEDGIERTKVVVRVPATSANLGPGFDAIGMALDMWSEFTVERSDKSKLFVRARGPMICLWMIPTLFVSV